MVHGAQHSVHLRRLEVLVTGMLLDTQFGQTVMHEMNVQVYSNNP